MKKLAVFALTALIPLHAQAWELPGRNQTTASSAAVAGSASHSTSNAGALAGSLSGSTAQGGRAVTRVGDVTSEGSRVDVATGDTSSTSSSGDSSVGNTGAYSRGGESLAKGGAVVNNVIDRHDYPDIPVNAVWTIPAVCTSSQAASALKLSVSSSETDSMCMRLSIAQTQWSMANQCGEACAADKETAMATVMDMSTLLEQQASGDRVYQQSKRWSGLVGFLGTVISIL